MLGLLTLSPVQLLVAIALFCTAYFCLNQLKDSYKLFGFLTCLTLISSLTPVRLRLIGWNPPRPSARCGCCSSSRLCSFQCWWLPFEGFEVTRRSLVNLLTSTLGSFTCLFSKGSRLSELFYNNRKYVKRSKLLWNNIENDKISECLKGKPVPLRPTIDGRKVPQGQSSYI